VSLAKFEDDPWDNSHESYKNSVFSIYPAPEFATAEVLVASLYRIVGFEGFSERDVPTAGREFAKSSSNARTQPGVPAVGRDTWNTILHGVLESPKQPNQSSRRFLQLCPVVPDIALYSGSARPAGNSWNPGALVERMIHMAAPSETSTQDLWQRLYNALSVSETDDVWARWLQGEFERRKRIDKSWAERSPPAQLGPSGAWIDCPARQFVRDLDAVLAAKPCMTRRQWISLLESILRFGTVMHVLWLCDVNYRLWKHIEAVLRGSEPLDEDKIPREIVNRTTPFLIYGNPALPLIRDSASRYLQARLGINLILHHLSKVSRSAQSLSSCADIRGLLVSIREARDMLLADGVVNTFERMRDVQARTIACKKGIGSNISEFARYTLGQRRTNNDALRSYDQGYFLRKRGEHNSAPWVVSLGPVAVLALAHCCLREAAGPRSVLRLCQHLERYGLEVDRDDVSMSELGRNLRMLGLVLDSPDAEGGMLLVPPFDSFGHAQERSVS